jgi:hypothetical protein
MTYIIITGKEISKNNTPHLQGYVEFRSPIRLSTSKRFNKIIHWEPRKATQKQAIYYCKTKTSNILLQNKNKQYITATQKQAIYHCNTKTSNILLQNR